MNEREIYLAVVKISGLTAQRAFLDDACGADLELRQRMESLLAARSERGDNLLASAAPPTVAGQPVDGAVGSTIASVNLESSSEDLSQLKLDGRFKLIEKIGQGGMGTVYMAEQQEPVRRKVAVKVIKRGMDSEQVVARFEAERQALALMNHPNIAGVLDAGMTEDGRPFFVMELVRGIPITAYCDRHKLSREQRLKLFISVCSAVQHAHQKGVIHRDLKPSNILVELHDVHHVPKVIDFGVAKATSQRLTDKTLYTLFSQMIGTPLYMSPEQAELSGLDVDTRSDIYSLGVLLYELITGTTPFDRETFKQASLNEIRRIICEDEPLRPSQRISTLNAGEASTVAEHQATDVRKLRQAKPRELDWIVVKAMEKDRNRRYESASGLAQDVQRHLDDEPVEACPPSLGYRLRKMARRNKGWVAASATVAAVLLVATVLSANLAIRATRAEHNAQQTSEVLREFLYASDVVLAGKDLRQNDARQARNRLARHIPTAAESDLRGFEWHYLWKQQTMTATEIMDAEVPIYDIAIAPSGESFAIVGADAILRVFKLTDYQLLHSIPTGQGETNGVAFSPDARQLATAGDDGSVRIWDLASESQLINIPAHDGMAYQVAFSPDGSVIASCGEEPMVRLWHVADGRELGTLNVDEEDLETIAISPAGVLAAGDRQSRVSTWNISQGIVDTPILETQPFSRWSAVSSLAFESNGMLAMGTVSGYLTIMAADGQTITYRRRLANGIQSLAFAPGGKWLVVGDRAGYIQVIPFEDGMWSAESIQQWKACDGRVYSVKVLPDGRSVLSGGADGRLVGWDVDQGDHQRFISLDRRCNNLCRISDDQMAVGTTDAIFWCDDDCRIVHQVQAPGDWYVQYASEARLLFARSVTEIVAWETGGNTEVFRRIKVGDVNYNGLALTPDAHFVFVRTINEDGDREIRMINAADQDIVAQWPVHSAAWLAVSPDGRWLVYDSNNDLHVFDIAAQSVIGSWPAHEGAIRKLKFGADSRTLVSVSDDRKIKLWSVPSGELLAESVAHRTSATCTAVTSDGRRIVTGGDDLELRFWEGSSLQLVGEQPLRRGQITDLAFSHDDRKLFCLCGRRGVVILDGSPTPTRRD